MKTANLIPKLRPSDMWKGTFSRDDGKVSKRFCGCLLGHVGCLAGANKNPVTTHEITPGSVADFMVKELRRLVRDQSPYPWSLGAIAAWNDKPGRRLTTLANIWNKARERALKKLKAAAAKSKAWTDGLPHGAD